MKRLLLTALLLLPFAPSFADDTVVMTLPDILTRADRDNLDVQSARLDLEKIHSRYWESLGTALPSVDLSGNVTRHYKPPMAFMNGGAVKTAKTNVATADLSAQQPLYTGGKVRTAIRLAQDAFAFQEDTTRATREEAAFIARRFYFAVLLTQRLSDIQHENLARAKDHLTTIRKRYDQGIDSDLALRRQEVEEAEARSLLLQADNMKETTLLALKDFLRMDLDQSIAVKGSFDEPRSFIPGADVLEKAALDHRPEIAVARAAVAVQADLRRLSWAEFQPTLAAYGRYQHFLQSNETDFTPKDEAESLSGGLSLTWNLFRGGQDIQKARQARMEWEQALLRQEKTERGIRRDVREKRLNLMEASERVSVQHEAVDHARLALKAVEIRYGAGRAGQLELNDATLAFNRARLAEAQALSDYWTGRAALERAVGITLEEASQ
jgi:outer membrane protein TolC